MAAVWYPPELARLPLPLRQAVREQCGGNWARVTVDGRGSVTVHNQPQPDGLKRQVRKRASKPARTEASYPRHPHVEDPPPGPVPAPPKVKLRRVEAAPHVPVAPIPMPERTRPEPPPAAPEPVRRAVPAARVEQPARRLRPAAEVLRREPTPTQRPPDERPDWVLLPGVDQPSDWDGSDLDDKAWRLARKVHRGLGDRAPLRFFDDVTALNGVDLEQVESIARHCDRVEVDPSTGWKKYPILRFHRGDNMVVVGFRDPILPLIMAAYFAAHLGANAVSGQLGVRATSGGGGSRKGGGLPNTPAKMLTALRALGAQVPEPGISDKVVPVTYQGRDVGKVPVEESTPRKDIESAYQRTLRRIEALKNRARSGKAL